MLGRSGLRVAYLARHDDLRERRPAAWGTSRRLPILDRYLESGGNFLDTADFYGRRTSEALLASSSPSWARDRVVVATKFSNNLQGSDSNGGGNGRKNMIRSVEASLRRLRTDYVDLYLVHTWDRITPVEEVVRAFDDLVRSGKVRHAGLSDVPAWYAARAQTYAEAHALTPPISLQLPYSLIERSSEYEFTTMAPVLGMGHHCPRFPLGNGLLGQVPAYPAGRRDGRLTYELS